MSKNRKKKKRINILQTDLNEKLQEIQDLESIHMAKRRKINLLEQKHFEEETEFKENILELERLCERLQKYLEEKETDLNNLTEKHEAELVERKTVNDQLKMVEEALVLVNTELKRKETMLEENNRFK